MPPGDVPPFAPRWKKADPEVLEEMRAEWDTGSWSGYLVHQFSNMMQVFIADLHEQTSC